MTNKIKMKATITWEYETDPKNYGTDNAKIDEENEILLMMEDIMETGEFIFHTQPVE